MAKVRNLSDIQQEIAFTEFDFYQQYVETFKTSELGRIQSLLPLREMAILFGLIEEKPKNIMAKRGRMETSIIRSSAASGSVLRTS